MGFDSMCDSKGSTHSGKNYLKTFSFLRKCLKTSLGWLFLAEYRDGFIGLYHTSWSTISCTQFQNSQFPLAVASKNGPLYLCVDYELSLFVSFYCCSRKWLLLFILSSLLELITEYLSTLSDTPVKYSSSHTSFFPEFFKNSDCIFDHSLKFHALFLLQRKKWKKSFFFQPWLKTPLLLFKTGCAAKYTWILDNLMCNSSILLHCELNFNTTIPLSLGRGRCSDNLREMSGN